MVKFTRVSEDEYYIDGEVTDEDFFINTESEHFDPANADTGKDAAVYSVPVSLKPSVLDEFARCKYMLESGVIGTFECTRLIQLVSMRMDAESIDSKNGPVISRKACDEANRKLRDWQSNGMEAKAAQIKKQLRTRLNRSVGSNNRECLARLFELIRVQDKESSDVTQALRGLEKRTKELKEAQKRLEDARLMFESAKRKEFSASLKNADQLTVDPLPDVALDALMAMARTPGKFSKGSKVARVVGQNDSSV